MNKLIPFKPNRWAIWMVIKDIQNYIDWINTIEREKANPNSLWHKFNMRHNFFYIVYLPLKLPDEDMNLPDSIKRLRVVEMLSPVHRYLDEELQFAEYIVPEFNQFYDDENKPTLMYGIIYRFAFKRLSLSWFLSRTIVISLITFLLIKYPIFSTIAEWLKNLM